MKNLLIASAAAFFSLNCFAWEKATLVQEGELYLVKADIPTEIELLPKQEMMMINPMVSSTKLSSAPPSTKGLTVVVKNYEQREIPVIKLDTAGNKVGLRSKEICVLAEAHVQVVQDGTDKTMSKVMCFAGVGDTVKHVYPDVKTATAQSGTLRPSYDDLIGTYTIAGAGMGGSKVISVCKGDCEKVHIS